MQDRIFLDFIVYLFDKSERYKHKKAKETVYDLYKRADLFISSQVLNEFIVIVTRKNKESALF